jgi:hypothetical protein
MWNKLLSLIQGNTVSDTIVEVPSTATSTGVNDFEKALAFVEDGVEKLGEVAKAELVELAKKYL